MFLTTKELKEKAPDIKSPNTNIYYLSEKYLIKEFLNQSGHKKHYRLERYRIAKEIGTIRNLPLPIDILETENGFSGYIEPVIPGTISNHLTEFRYVLKKDPNTSLEAISDYFLKCAEIVAACHREGIINPDMASNGNILYNYKTGEVYFTDYQDMQVRNINTSTISSYNYFDPVIISRKYQQNAIFNENIDLYTLTTLFFYYTTHISLTSSIRHCDLETMLNISGYQNTPIGECLRVLYDPNRPNLDIREPIIKTCHNYTLEPYQRGEVRKLIKK